MTSHRHSPEGFETTLTKRWHVDGGHSLEAYRADGGGIAILWMGKTGRSKTVPNLRRRAYRITGKVRNRPGKPRRQSRRCG